jgi:hypothetical protein
MEFQYWYIILIYIIGTYGYALYKIYKGEVINSNLTIYDKFKSTRLVLFFIFSPIIYAIIIVFICLFDGPSFLLDRIRKFFKEKREKKIIREINKDEIIIIPDNPFYQFELLPDYKERIEALIKWCDDNPYKDDVWSLIREASTIISYIYSESLIPPSDWDAIPYSNPYIDHGERLHKLLLSLSSTLDERAMHFLILATTINFEEQKDTYRCTKKGVLCKTILPYLANFKHREAIIHLKNVSRSDFKNSIRRLSNAENVLDQLKKTGKTPIKWSPKIIPSKIIKNKKY